MKTLKIACFSLLIFAGTAAFGQTDPKDKNAADQARKRDSEAFDNYFARRATAAAIKDSVDAATVPPVSPKKSASTPDNADKLYTAGQKIQQGNASPAEDPVISMPSMQLPKKMFR